MAAHDRQPQQGIMDDGPDQRRQGGAL
jgi:hypothetical protein